MRCVVSAIVFVAIVASPAAAATAPAGEPALRPEEALPTIRWSDAPDYIGREVFAVGQVVSSSRARTGHAFLNFERQRGGGLVIFIHKDVYDLFAEPPESACRDRMIQVRGFVSEYRGAPQIAVTHPGAIRILPEGAPLPPPASRPSAAMAAPKDTVTIGTYNVLNLFDAIDDVYTADEATPPKPRAELDALARTIRRLDADVLALQEVENRGVLQHFVDALLGDMGYEVVLFEGNDTRGIDVALLSRLPVGSVTSHRHHRFPDARGRTIRYQRDLLQVSIRPPAGQPFDVFVVHLKSKGGEDDGGIDIRQGEALHTRRILDEVLSSRPDARFVICGDFNDTIDSLPLRTLIGSGPSALTTFTGELSSEETITYNQPPYLSMIDFIFASPAMAEHYVTGSYRVILGGSPEASGSDHNPVIAQFKLR